MNKQDQKHLDRAAQHGRGALLRTMAVIHRSGSARTQREIEAQIYAVDAGPEFTWINGTMLHNSEL
jgi:hypothetical protein